MGACESTPCVGIGNIISNITLQSPSSGPVPVGVRIPLPSCRRGLVPSQVGCNNLAIPKGCRGWIVGSCLPLLSSSGYSVLRTAIAFASRILGLAGFVQDLCNAGYSVVICTKQAQKMPRHQDTDQRIRAALTPLSMGVTDGGWQVHEPSFCLQAAETGKKKTPEQVHGLAKECVIGQAKCLTHSNACPF